MKLLKRKVEGTSSYLGTSTTSCETDEGKTTTIRFSCASPGQHQQIIQEGQLLEAFDGANADFKIENNELVRVTVSSRLNINLFIIVTVL